MQIYTFMSLLMSGGTPLREENTCGDTLGSINTSELELTSSTAKINMQTEFLQLTHSQCYVALGSLLVS